MKYHIFDAAVILTFIAAARIMIKGGNVAPLAPECPEDDTSYSATNETYVSISSQERRRLRADEQPQVPSRMNTDAAHQIPSAEDGKLQQEGSSTPVQTPDHLEIGQLVELYGPESMFAAPAFIRDKLDDDTYLVQNLITNVRRQSHIPSNFLHPYQAYEIGTKGWCSIGPPGSGKIELTPCTILDMLAKGTITKGDKNNGSFIFYQVEYFDRRENGKHHVEYLPFSRVQRVRKDRVARNTSR